MRCVDRYVGTGCPEELGMHLQIYPDVATFTDLAGPALLAREAEHNLMLGLLSELARNPLLFGARPPYMAAVLADGAPRALALMTPPHNLILAAGCAPEALALIADDLCQRHPELPGVVGPVADSAAFARLWQVRRGGAARRALAERIYQLTEVRPPAGVPGRLRLAGPPDLALVTDWIGAFAREALGEEGAGAARAAERWLAGRARCTCGTTGVRRRWPASPGRRRTACASAWSTPRPSGAGAATPAPPWPRPASSSSTPGGASASCSPIWATRPRTISTRRSATGRSAMWTSGALRRAAKDGFLLWRVANPPKLPLCG